MKLTAIIPAYNEAIFLPYVVDSLLPFVDEVIFINQAMKAAMEAGYPLESSDGTTEIIKQYTINNNKCKSVPLRIDPPETHRDLVQPALEIAKNNKADWVFHVCGDEVWPAQALSPMKKILKKSENQGILGLNVWMYHFAPDFWNYKDFRNPRLAKVTDDAEMISGDALVWPKQGVWQYAGNTKEKCPPNTPEKVRRVNDDYPKFLRAFHYSCVGKERVNFKVDFFKKLNNTYGDIYNEAYTKEDWGKFRKMGFKKFNKKHPEIMKKHPLYDQKIIIDAP